MRALYLIAAQAYIVYALDAESIPRTLYVGDDPPAGITIVGAG